MKDFTIFNEMTIEEIAMYLEKGDVPVRKFGTLPKDTGFHKGQGKVPMRDNSVEKRKGYDPLEPDVADLDDFLDEVDADDITLKKSKYMLEECDDDEDDDSSHNHYSKGKKKLIEPNEVEEESETLEEDFDIDAELSSLLEDTEDMAILDEELNDIESFLENYID